MCVWQQDQSYGGMRMATSIHGILGGKKPSSATFNDWIRKIDDKQNFDLKTFLKDNSKDKYMELSDEAISALIAFEHDERQTENEATKRLNRLFPDDKQITLEFVKKQYKNIAQVKQGLKRAAPIDGKPKVPTKKVKK